MIPHSLQRVGLVLASGLLILAVLAPAARAQRQAYGAPEVDIWAAARHYGPGEQVRFTVTVDRPCFVRVFAVDDAGRRHPLTRDPRGARVSPRNPLRSHERSMHALWGPNPRGEITIVAVAQQDPFHGRQEERYLLRAETQCTILGQARGMRTRPLQVSLRAGVVWGSAFAGGARVFLDGILIGHGPMAVVAAVPGVHRMTVVTPRGQKHTRRVTIDAADRYGRALVYDSRGR